MAKHQHLHRKQHGTSKAAGKSLPHLAEAAHPETGKVDMAQLKAGQDAWNKAIEAGEYELVSATEIGIDEDTDVLVVTRRKLK